MISGEHGIYIYTDYSQISNNCPFVSGQFYLRTLFSILVVPPGQTVFIHSRKQTFSRKWKRTLDYKNLIFFFCSRFLVGGHPMQTN